MTSDIATRADIEKLERHVLRLPQVDLGTTSELSGEVCARTIRIPAGTVLTGAEHNKDAINIVCGDITVTTDDGPKRFTGYHVIPSKAGTKRAGYAHADTVWTTCWHTKLTDPTSIEDEMTDESDRLQSRNPQITATTQDKLEN